MRIPVHSNSFQTFDNPRPHQYFLVFAQPCLSSFVRYLRCLCSESTPFSTNNVCVFVCAREHVCDAMNIIKSEPIFTSLRNRIDTIIGTNCWHRIAVCCYLKGMPHTNTHTHTEPHKTGFQTFHKTILSSIYSYIAICKIGPPERKSFSCAVLWLWETRYITDSLYKRAFRKPRQCLFLGFFIDSAMGARTSASHTISYAAETRKYQTWIMVEQTLRESNSRNEGRMDFVNAYGIYLSPDVKCTDTLVYFAPIYFCNNVGVEKWKK